jgi:hypothetical protein
MPCEKYQEEMRKAVEEGDVTTETYNLPKAEVVDVKSLPEGNTDSIEDYFATEESEKMTEQVLTASRG